MAQTVEVNGKTYRVWYMHRHWTSPHMAEQDPVVTEAYEDALESGHIKEHAIDRPYFRGVTCCQLEDENRNVVAKGYSFCSEKDNFNRKIGRAISLGRAKKALS